MDIGTHILMMLAGAILVLAGVRAVIHPVPLSGQGAAGFGSMSPGSKRFFGACVTLVGVWAMVASGLAL